MKKTILTIAMTSILLPNIQAQNVGIGTNNPIEKLDVNGDMYLRGDDIYFSHDEATNINNDYLSYDDVNSLIFGGQGVFHLQSDVARGRAWNQPTATISASGGYFLGRVGIGTLNPASITHISGGNGSAVLTIEADENNSGEGNNPRIDLLQDGGTVGAMIGYFDGAVNNGNTFRIGIKYNGIDDWTPLTIDALTKNIGIGTETPTERLEIQGGGLQFNNSFGIGFAGEIPNDGVVSGDRAKMYYDGAYGGTNIDFLVIEKTDGNSTDPDGGIAFAMKGSDNVRESAMVIRGNKRVGLQTIISPIYALELPNSTTNGVGRGRANAWVTYSDGRIKTSRQPLTYGLQTVLQMNPLHYQQHNSTNDAKGNIVIEEAASAEIGFVAQELHKLVPEAVYEPTNETTDLWAVDYTKLVPVLTKAIQQQQESIQRLEEKCATLEQKIEKLEK